MIGMTLLFGSLEIPDFLVGLIIVAVSILVARIVLYFTRRYLRPWAERSETTLDDEIIKATQLPIYLSLIHI